MSKRICTFEGCGRPHEAKGLCNAHYRQLQRRGYTFEIGSVKPRRPPSGLACSFEGCDRPYEAGGFCRAHYSQFRATGGVWEIGANKRQGELTMGWILSWTREAGECREWSRSRNKDGYGELHARGRTRRVHRVMLELKLGRKLAAGECVRHTCDNPPCVNPDHLVVGTQRDNVQDAIARGRHRNVKGQTNAA